MNINFPRTSGEYDFCFCVSGTVFLYSTARVTLFWSGHSDQCLHTVDKPRGELRGFVCVCVCVLWLVECVLQAGCVAHMHILYRINTKTFYVCVVNQREPLLRLYGSFRFGSNCVAFVVDVKTSILSYVVGNVATMVLMSETKLSEMHLAGPGHPYSSLLLCVIFLVKFLIWGGKWLVWWGLFCNGNKKVAAFRMLWRSVFRAFWKWNVFVCVDQSLWRGNTDFLKKRHCTDRVRCPKVA